MTPDVFSVFYGDQRDSQNMQCEENMIAEKIMMDREEEENIKADQKFKVERLQEERKIEKFEEERQCTKCLEPCMSCIEKDEKYRELKRHTTNLSSDFKDTKEAYNKLNKSVNELRTISLKDMDTISMLQETVKDKQMEVNTHLDTISKLKLELEIMKIEKE
ncbi:hypothetical protein Hanom_Chr00s000188g01627751 [Helianthus anomalus]